MHYLIGMFVKPLDPKRRARMDESLLGAPKNSNNSNPQWP
jgi:hypothetical protein